MPFQPLLKPESVSNVKLCNGIFTTSKCTSGQRTRTAWWRRAHGEIAVFLWLVVLPLLRGPWNNHVLRLLLCWHCMTFNGWQAVRQRIWHYSYFRFSSRTIISRRNVIFSKIHFLVVWFLRTNLELLNKSGSALSSFVEVEIRCCWFFFSFLTTW